MDCKRFNLKSWLDILMDAKSRTSQDYHKSKNIKISLRD
jgi:hypothetical protein